MVSKIQIAAILFNIRSSIINKHAEICRSCWDVVDVKKHVFKNYTLDYIIATCRRLHIPESAQIKHSTSGILFAQWEEKAVITKDYLDFLLRKSLQEEEFCIKIIQEALADVRTRLNPDIRQATDEEIQNEWKYVFIYMYDYVYNKDNADIYNELFNNTLIHFLNR